MNDEIWNLKNRNYELVPDEMLNFINEIEEVCKKHNLSISHEDGHGSFIIDKFNSSNIKSLKYANRNF